MNVKMNGEEAKTYVDGIYRQVADRWQQRVSSSQFMKALVKGKLPKETFRLFFKNWAAYTIEINTLEAASYHKHIHFFRKHRDLMAAMAEKLADELIHPKPPGHIHVVIETAKALGISEDEVFISPMLAEFRAKIDYFRAIVWEGTVAEFYAAGATEEQFGHWAGEVFTALTTSLRAHRRNRRCIFRFMRKLIRESMRAALWDMGTSGKWFCGVYWRKARR